MVNGYFFESNDRHHFEEFLKSIRDPTKCMIFCDPPFKISLKLVLDEIGKIGRILFDNSQHDDEIPSCGSYLICLIKFFLLFFKKIDNLKIPVIFVLPFFFDKKFARLFPKFSLLDYKVRLQRLKIYDYV